MLVLLGGMVVSVLPPSTPVLRSGALQAIRGAEAGRMSALTLVLIGLGLLAGAWLALCRHVALAQGEDRHDALDLVRFATALWSAPLVLAPPLFSRDGWSYAAQGMLAREGLSPYAHGPGVLGVQVASGVFRWEPPPVIEAVDQMWMTTATPYGPLPIFFGKVAAGVTGNPWLLVVAHRGLALAGLVLLAWAVPRLAAWTGVNPALASALVLVSPLMVANGVGGLHNDLVMAGLMAAALVVALERGWAWGAVLGGLAAAVKVPGGLVCVGIALLTMPVAATVRDRVRRLAQVALVALATLLGVGLATGLGSGWVGALAVPGTINTPLSVTTLAGGLLDWVALHLGLGLEPATFRDLVRGLGELVVVGVIGWVCLRWRTGDRHAAVAAVAVVAGTFVVLCPVVHLWYFLVLPPFLAVLPLPRLATCALLSLSVILGLVAPLDSSLHGAYYAIVLGCMVLAVLVPVLLLTRRARERMDRIASSRWLLVQ